MPNLFIASGIFHPESGGPATYLHHIAPHLQAAGWDVRLLTYGTPRDDDATHYPYPVTRIERDALPVRTSAYARAAWPLMRWADLVYIHSFMLPLPRLPFDRTPRVMKIVGDGAWERAVRKGWVSAHSDIDTFQLTRQRHPMAAWNARTRRREVRSLDAVIVPSNYLKRMAVRWGAPSPRVHVVYNALPPAQQTVAMSQAVARAALSWDDAPTVLAPARLVPWKGIDTFIEALADVPDVRLFVAGDGEQRSAWEALAVSQGVADRVTFLGRVPHERVALMMRAADYVGLYSGYEGLSHVLLESLRVGTPVIASDKGGNPEVITHGHNGLLVRYKSTDALREALREAFADGTRAKLAAHASIGEPFTYKRMVADTLDVLGRYL